ncbi:hypothetical protein QQF64_016892 [Cirrhinus molitorella]|uniref:Uncharacterized protein n=1 Tax=Cirrhinus molitorella TaxID=172907 RepID=A0ABR3LP29_9TELE
MTLADSPAPSVSEPGQWTASNIHKNAVFGMLNTEQAASKCMAELTHLSEGYKYGLLQSCWAVPPLLDSLEAVGNRDASIMKCVICSSDHFVE